jgi:putative transcriptional regulator
MRVRLKADGRVVEIRDGPDAPLVDSPPLAPKEHEGELEVRELRKRLGLTQSEFAGRLGLPVDTVRNWEQGKRAPRGPARALLLLISRAPRLAFEALKASA